MDVDIGALLGRFILKVEVCEFVHRQNTTVLWRMNSDARSSRIGPVSWGFFM